MFFVSLHEFVGNWHELWAWEIMGSPFHFFPRFILQGDKEYYQLEFLELPICIQRHDNVLCLSKLALFQMSVLIWHNASCCPFSMVVSSTTVHTHHFLTGFDSTKYSQNKENENTQDTLHSFFQPLKNICDV